MNPPRFIAPDWPAPTGVCALTTTRAWPGDWQDPAQRRRLMNEFGLPAEPRWLRQVHGTAVVTDAQFTASAPHAEPAADASITCQHGAVLAVRTADCLPILLAAEDGSAVAAIHAGWRGLAAGVVGTTLARWPVDPAKTLAWIGPAAGPSAYEVDATVRSAFVERDPMSGTAFRDSRPGHWWCDLPALARRQLATLGIKQCAGGDRCTILESDTFYSWRRASEPGRMVTLVWMEG